VSGDGASVMTDGRYVLVLARPDALAEAGVTVGDAPTASGRADAGLDPAAASPRALAAFALSSGAPVWATRLPADVQGVWPYGGDLLGYGDSDVVVLN
jgi:zona occludens toxin (predicted ATPase)